MARLATPQVATSSPAVYGHLEGVPKFVIISCGIKNTKQMINFVVQKTNIDVSIQRIFDKTFDI